MSFDPDQFLAQTSTPEAGGFDPDKFLSETEPKSAVGFAKNAWNDVTGTVKGMGQLVTGLATHPIDTTVGVATHLPGAIVNEGKRLGIGELITGHPINAVEKFGGALYDKPLTTVLDVLPAAGAVGKAVGIGGKAAKGVELASEAAQAGKAGDVAAAAEAANAARAGGSLADDFVRAAGEAQSPCRCRRKRRTF